MSEFPEKYGFIYCEEFDEWSKPTFNGKHILWEKPNYPNHWQLSYVDEEDYLHPIYSGYESNIVGVLRGIDRDRKISELLNS